MGVIYLRNNTMPDNFTYFGIYAPVLLYHTRGMSNIYNHLCNIRQVAFLNKYFLASWISDFLES